jgi:uncharacterized Zn-binding protein involved in type VI secretion
MPAVARVNVDNADAILVSGANTVFVNGRPAAIESSITQTGNAVIEGATTVYAEGKPLARQGDATSRGIPINSGATDVSAADSAKFLANLTVADVSFVIEQGDGDGISDPAADTASIQHTVNSGIQNGTVGSGSSTLSNSRIVGASDNYIPPYIDTSIVTLNWDRYNQDNIPYDTLMLTERTSLAAFTTRATLWNNQPRPLGPNTVYQGGGDNKFIKAQYGLTVPQILHNLSNLARHVYEPILDQYPNAVVTNTFRQGPPGGSSQKQHGTGQAMDIVFPGASHSEYYKIALWIRDHIAFDQLLQEKAGSTMWIHVSHFSGFGTRVAVQNRVANLIVSPITQFIPGLAVLA